MDIGLVEARDRIQTGSRKVHVAWNSGDTILNYLWFLISVDLLVLTFSSELFPKQRFMVSNISFNCHLS